MRVISLEAENFKRLRAVSITPEGAVVEVTGDNGEGKTSTLDAIWAALGGKDACPDKPIHTGADKAEVRLVLGDGGEPKLKVTRRFRLKEGVPYTTDLTVENAEGARYGKPQDVLNAILGEFCFDPLAFTRLKDEEQVRALRKFVPGIDFAQVEGLNRADYQQRTEVNRTAAALKAKIDTFPTFEGEEPQPVDEDAIVAKLAGAAEAERVKARLTANEQRVAQLRAQIAQAEKTIADIEAESAGLVVPEPVDAEAIHQQLRDARAANELLAKFRARAALAAERQAAEEQSMALTANIEKRTQQAAEAVAHAQMPVEGLGFAQDAEQRPYVTLAGEPFSQASQAQKIRTSVAIAAAMNPRLRVARVSDGSLLDRKSWAALTEYAEANDLQVWCETISAHTPAAILIEDGGVAPVADPGDVV